MIIFCYNYEQGKSKFVSSNSVNIIAEGNMLDINTYYPLNLIIYALMC